MKRVGWMPWVQGSKSGAWAALGPWVGLAARSHSEAHRKMRLECPGFHYVLVPIFAEPPKKRRSK